MPKPMSVLCACASFREATLLIIRSAWRAPFGLALELTENRISGLIMAYLYVPLSSNGQERTTFSLSRPSHGSFHDVQRLQHSRS